MKVSSNHWLEGVKRIKYPEGPPMNIRRFLVIHYTEGASAESSINFWKTSAAKGAEAHIIINRDGTIIQIRATNQTADHAGKSSWKDPRTGKTFSGLNSCSIGIELANGGSVKSLRERYSKLLPVKARHRNGGPLQEWEAYPEAQILALIEVSKALVKRYNLDDLVGHDYIAPDRKTDPGPAFPLQRVREACGFQGLPKP